MAVVKIGDSALVRLAQQTVSVVLAKKSRIPSFICVSVLFLSSSNGGLMWQTGRWTGFCWLSAPAGLGN